jgi:DNA-binding HxlR family transcriptional regulator
LIIRMSEELRKRISPRSHTKKHEEKLKRRLGSISTKTLTERLRLLESEGWISQHYEPVVPPQVTYAITAKVLELDGVMIELDRIAEQWYGKKRKEN